MKIELDREAKSTDPLDVITDLGIKLEYGCGMFNGRPVRYLENLGIFQVGDDNFDRWANSLDFEFDDNLLIVLLLLLLFYVIDTMR